MKQIIKITIVSLLLVHSFINSSFGTGTCTISADINTGTQNLINATSPFLDIQISPSGPYVVGDQIMISVDTMMGLTNSLVTAAGASGDISYCMCLEMFGADLSMILVNGESVVGSINGGDASMPVFPFSFNYTFPAEGSYIFELKCATNISFMGLVTSQNDTKNGFQKAFLNSNLPLGAITIGEAIPTLSQWGLIILGIAMLIFGIVAIRERVMKSSTDA